MQKFPLSLLAAAWLFCAALPARAADGPVASLLPAAICGDGWKMDGTVSLLDRETLSDRINGEAELYFPYGFEALAFARYVHAGSPSRSFDVDVYLMGSLRDAFGMYANYRRRDDAEAKVGAEGIISASQLFFYQDRYLVRLQSTGSPDPSQKEFLACAQLIARNLPRASGRPRELEAFRLPEVETGSERYVAQSLLGYDFFRRGFVADAAVSGSQAQLFLVTEESPALARKALEAYRSYLKDSGGLGKGADAPGLPAVHGVDPLYGTVVLEQSGTFLIGMARVKDLESARRIIEQVRNRLAALGYQ